ncbi:MAG: hypothetical protein ACUVV6_09545 [Thermoplasmatota archaeon]
MGGGRAPEMSDAEVRVWLRIRRDDKSLSLKEVFEKMEEIRKKVPDQDVYFDGDEFAICSRPLRRAHAHQEPHHKPDAPGTRENGRKRGRQARLT